jgi:hypothetical protein
VRERIIYHDCNVSKVCILYNLPQQYPEPIGNPNEEFPRDEIYWSALPEFKRLPLPSQLDVAPTRVKVHAIIMNGVSNKAKKVEKLDTVRWLFRELRPEQAFVY